MECLYKEDVDRIFTLEEPFEEMGSGAIEVPALKDEEFAQITVYWINPELATTLNQLKINHNWDQQIYSMEEEDENHDENANIPPPVPPTQQAPHTLSTIKLPILKKEGLHKGYERFQSLLSQLEIHSAGVSTEDANQKFLRSLPASWSQVSLIMRTKPGVNSLSFDDFYNNLRVFEPDVKGSTRSSSSTQNVAFVFSSTSSTNDVSTAYGVSTSSGHNSQKEGSSSYTMKLTGQISMSIEEVYKKTGRKLQFDAKEPVGFDKTKARTLEMSAKDKSGLGYGDQIHEGVSSYENEVLESVFDSRSSDVEDSLVNDRFVKVEGMHAVPPPMTGIYMPPKYDFGIDESKFTYGPKQSKTSESDAKTSDFASSESNSSVETLESYESDNSDDEYMIKPSKEQEKPSFAFVNTIKHVKTARENVKEQKTCSPSPKADKRDRNGLMSKNLGLGYGFTRKACFVCGSFDHLIRDCDFYKKRMAKQADPEVSVVEPRTPPTTTSIFDDEDITMAQTLIKMKEEKAKEKGVAFKDVEDSSRPVRSITTLKPLPSIDPKDKGKGILVEEEPVKIKRKDQGIDQIERDEELAHKLHEEELAEIARIQEEKAAQEEASRVAIMEMFDEVQAGIDADALFAAKLQQEEREEYTIEERAKFLAETIAAQRKFRAAQRAAEIRSRPPTKSQLRNLMMTYLKNMGGYKHSQLKAKTFEEIQAMYERQKKKIDDFKPMDSDDAVKDSKKAAGEDTSKKEEVLKEPDSTKIESMNKEDAGERVSDVSKKRKGGPRMKRMSKRKKTESDLEEEEDLKTFLKIVPDKERIIDYERFETITPEGVDLVLWGDLRTMFEANTEDKLWQNQERWNLKSWNFYENCGVHTLTLEDGTEIHMLVERKYPLTKETLKRMMSLKLIAESVRDSAYDLLRFIQKQIDEVGSHDGGENDL
ncbi:hypothetical protein Tco_0629099 [Tanacetum coccineum]|uniref:CCHC-type domain-containing protein n=1 Tax=Tanacetum coccineum TaxID=301880 RepID=A0ABQ4WSA4_9ASTR